MAETKTYRIEGLSCVDCAGRIEAALGRLEGIDDASVDELVLLVFSGFNAEAKK